MDVNNASKDIIIARATILLSINKFSTRLIKMNLSDICLCNKSLRRATEVIRLVPCRHLLDKCCWERLKMGKPDMPCPYCGSLMAEHSPDVRKKCIGHSNEDRARIINAASGGDCWLSLAETLGIPRSTAEDWIRSGELSPKPRGGKKVGILKQEHTDVLIQSLERDSQLTLKQLKAILADVSDVSVQVSQQSRGDRT